jgi:hypothetical protein
LVIVKAYVKDYVFIRVLVDARCYAVITVHGHAVLIADLDVLINVEMAVQDVIIPVQIAVRIILKKELV